MYKHLYILCNIYIYMIYVGARDGSSYLWNKCFVHWLISLAQASSIFKYKYCADSYYFFLRQSISVSFLLLLETTLTKAI